MGGFSVPEPGFFRGGRPTELSTPAVLSTHGAQLQCYTARYMDIQKFYADNKTIVWVVGAVVILGSAWCLSANYSGESDRGASYATTTPTLPKGTTTKPPTTTSGTVKTGATPKPTPTSAKIVGVGTLSYLFSFREPLICAIKSSTYVKRSGTMYIAEGKMRANFVGTSMLHDGMYLYAWATGASTGLKLPAASSVSGSLIATKGGFDLANDISFACNPWKTDASVFVPPSSIVFSETL